METVGIVPALRDGPLRDRDGLLLGRVEDLLYDAASNRPAWLVVRLSDGADAVAGAPRRTLAPAGGLRCGVAGLQLGIEAAAVRACPVALSGVAVLREHVAAACRHYAVRRCARGDSFTSAAPALDLTRAA